MRLETLADSLKCKEFLIRKNSEICTLEKQFFYTYSIEKIRAEVK